MAFIEIALIILLVLLMGWVTYLRITSGPKSWARHTRRDLDALIDRDVAREQQINQLANQISTLMINKKVRRVTIKRRNKWRRP